MGEQPEVAAWGRTCTRALWERRRGGGLTPLRRHIPTRCHKEDHLPSSCHLSVCLGGGDCAVPSSSAAAARTRRARAAATSLGAGLSPSAAYCRLKWPRAGRPSAEVTGPHPWALQPATAAYWYGNPTCNRGLRLPLTKRTHTSTTHHSRHDADTGGRGAGRPGNRSREGRERKEVRLGRCGANDAYGDGGDKEWRHREEPAVGFVDSAGEATGRAAKPTAWRRRVLRRGQAQLAASRREPGTCMARCARVGTGEPVGTGTVGVVPVIMSNRLHGA